MVKRGRLPKRLAAEASRAAKAASMRRLLMIGMGAGDPEHLTMQAIAALNEVDVFFVMDKGGVKDDLARLRREICERYIHTPRYRLVQTRDPVRDPTIASYAERVDVWHAERAALYEAMLRDELADDGVGAFLVWGEPALYDSTLRIVEQVVARGNVAFSYEIIPGISSIQVLAARHKVALNRIGGAVHITTGRNLTAGLDPALDDVVVMLDGECAFKTLPGEAFTIYWGAYLGTARELLVAGKLSDVSERIERVRNQARAEHGWIMDTYLLRRNTRKAPARDLP
jgi:precorrin-6A synthase